MTAVRVYLFRDFSIERNGSPLPVVENRKVKELLSYLLLYPERPHRREALMNLLWKDASAEKSRRNMRQALWQLQRQIDSVDCPEGQRFLSIDGDWVQINAQTDLWCDVIHFQQAYRRVQGKKGYELHQDVAQVLREAVALYRGELLEGWYQDWCLIEREHLQNLYLIMLDKLMDYCELHHLYEEGIAHGIQSLRQDLVRERTYWQLMRLYALLGNRAGALRHYEQCSAVLRREYQVEPAERTQRLYEAIRHDRFPPPEPPRQPSVTGGASASPGLTRLLAQIAQLADDLDSARQGIGRELESISRHARGNGPA